LAKRILVSPILTMWKAFLPHDAAILVRSWES